MTNPFLSLIDEPKDNDNPFLDLIDEKESPKRTSWISTQVRAGLAGVAQTGLGTLSRVAGALDAVTPSKLRSGMGPRFAQMSEGVRERLAPKDEGRRQEYDAGVLGASIGSEFLKYGGAGQLAARVPQLVSRLGRTRAAATGGFGLGGVEDVGSTPEESTAALGKTAADAVGFERTGRALDRASQTAGGRALVGAAAGAIPEALLGSRGRRPPRSPVQEPITDPRRLLPSTTSPISIGPMQGPAIPMRGEVEPSTIAKILEDAAARVPRPEGIEVVSGLRARTRQRQAKNMRSVRQSQAEIDADLTSRRALPTEDVEASTALEQAAAMGKRDRSSGLIVRPGTIAPELLAQGGLGAVGGVTGAVTGDPEDPADIIGRAIIGFGFGATAGRLAPRLAKRVSNSRIPAAAPAVPPSVATEGGKDYLNVARITDDPDLQRRLADNAAAVASEGGVASRQPRRAGESLGRLDESESFDTLRKRVANTFGLPTDDFVARTGRNERVGRVELLAAERTMAGLTTEANTLFEQIRLGALVGPEKDRAMEMVARLQKEASSLFSAYSKQVTETARDLSALRMGIRGTDNPLVWQARLEQLARRPLTVGETAEATRLAQTQDREGLIELARSVQNSSPREKFNAVMKAGMLSNPSTWSANFFGNAAMQVLENAKDIPATVMDRIAAQFMANGVRTKNFSPSKMLKASVAGAERGLQDAKKVWRDGYTDAGKFDVGREVNFGTGFGGRMATVLTRSVFRGMEAVDQLFLQSAFVRSLDEQARVVAQAEGLSGQALATRVEDILKNPPLEISADAMLAAKLATFRNDTELTRSILQLREDLPYNIGHFIVPFAKTPVNIAGRVIDYSPIGLTRSLSRFAKYVTRGVPDAAIQRKMVEDVGRGSIGSAAILLGYFAAKDGKMTGFYPYDQRTRNEWKTTNKSEGSLLIDGDWMQVTRLSPLGNLMQIGAAMYELESGKISDPTDAVIAGFTAPAQTIVELPMVSGARDFIETIRKLGTPEAGEAGRQALGRVVGGFIPASSLLRGVASGTDQFVRDPQAEDTGEEIKRRAMSAVPVLSQRLPVRLDPLGQPVRRNMGLAETLLSPMRRTESLTASNPLRAELERTNAVVTPVSRRKGEDDETFRRRQERTGQVVYQQLQNAVAAPSYRGVANMNVDRLRQMLEDVGEDATRLTDDEIRARWQGLILEGVVSRAKAAVAKQFPDPRGGRQAKMLNALTRN